MELKMISRVQPKEIEKDCWKIIQAAKVAVLENNRGAYVQQMRKVCKLAVKYDMLECASISSTFLAHYYYNSHTHRSIADRYFSLAKKYQVLHTIENDLLIDLQPLKYKLNATFNPSKKIKEELKCFADKIEKYLELDSITISTHCYMPLMRYYELIGDNDRMKALCEEAIIKTEQNGRNHHFQNVAAQIALREERFDEAKLQINQALTALPEGTNSYSYFLLTAIKIELYDNNVDEAIRLLNQNKWKKVSDRKLHEWEHIIKGYLDFLSPNRTFRIGKFLNEIYIVDRDKGGIHLNITIIYFLYYLRRNRAKLVDVQEAIDRYQRRHTKGAHKAFLKFLVGVIRYNFKRQVVELRMKKVMKEVRQAAPDTDIEVFPYSMLMDKILDEL